MRELAPRHPAIITTAVLLGIGALGLKESFPTTPAEAEIQIQASQAGQVLKHCTSIRRRAKDIYMGRACREDGDTYQIVNGGYAEKGWFYSAIYVGGIYKCGYVRAGVLQEAELRSDVISSCISYYDPLVKQRYKYLHDYNCKELKPGLEGCKSGTYYSPLQKPCRPKKVKLFGNFATDNPTPFNVLGTGEGGFSMTLPNIIKKAVSYRVAVNHGSGDGKAIIVSDINDTHRLDWGLMPSICVSKHDRQGGVPTGK